jgi:hypothetical protein
MKALVLVLAAALALPAFAQRGERGGRDFAPKRPGMSQDERERMRQDMRDVYRDRGERARPPERPRQMTPQDREKLRRDIQDANRDLKR